MSSTTGFGEGAFGTSPLGTQPFFDTASLITAILTTTGHGSPTSETTKRRQILQFINNRYQSIMIGTHWRWLKASYDFNLDAPYLTGTVTATLNDQPIVGVATAWSSLLVKPKDIFFLDGSSTVYHVSTLESSTGLTLETKFSEDTAADSGYTLARNQYELPAETDHLVSFSIDGYPPLVPMGEIEFRRMQSQDPTSTGCPRAYSLIRRDTDDDSVYIEVFPAPDRAYQCHIDYTVRIAYLFDDADCYPIIPDRYRSVLYYGALAEFQSVVLRDPSNSAKTEGLYNSFLNQMRNDTQLTDDRFQIVRARNYLRRTAQTRGRGVITRDEFGRED